MELLRNGSDPLDAVIAGVNIVELDPEDMTVGYGGLPNERGVVELDSCVMHGPTHKAGAVAALRNIATPSLVAQRVMERTDHVLLVGEGALEFARAHGFKEQNLLTDAAREAWLRWKERLSPEDDWIAPPEPENEQAMELDGSRARRLKELVSGVPFTWGTINCNCVDAQGNIGGVTTTSGLSYKLPGRVGDSPIIGAGLYVDNEVGAAGSTGRGEANLQNCSCFAVVEFMRNGMSPEAACLEAAKRIVDRTEPRLRRKDGTVKFDVKFYAVAKDGRFGGAGIWSGAKMAVANAAGNRLVDCAYLFERPTDQTTKKPTG
jgi:N4-(beta-N-acetylglucosaminyl)-L-asparaginase